MHYLIKKNLSSTKTLSKIKLPFVKTILNSKRELLSQIYKLYRFIFIATLNALNYFKCQKKKDEPVYQRIKLVATPFFSELKKKELYSLTNLTFFYIFFKTQLNKKELLSKSTVLNFLNKLKLASLQRNHFNATNNAPFRRNSTTDLATFQTLNDYFFAPSFYTSINKKSR